MFKKILIAEDHESINISVQKTLEDLNIPIVDYVYYCDDAIGKIQKALREKQPYDLLIQIFIMRKIITPRLLKTVKTSSKKQRNCSRTLKSLYFRRNVKAV